MARIQRQNRVDWCRRRFSWSVEQWQSVIFSDEVRFCLKSDGIVKVWGPQHRRFDPRYTVKKSKDRRSIMFWGFIRHDGYRLLLRCPESFTSSDYQIFLVIAKTAMIGENFIFQDDNCPVHRSHAVQEWFQNSNVPRITWPPYSPDLNPIENVWAFMKKRLSQGVRTRETLEEDVWETWNSIPQTFIDSLFCFMPRRIRKCLQNRGSIINYWSLFF